MSISYSNLVSDDGCHISRRLFADENLYRLELTHIFSRNWLYVGHESQLESVGDFISTHMGETPVIVARGGDGKVHVSLNSCTHRGVPVCRADRGNTKRFVCPYHNWSYTVEGDLVAVPQERKVCSKLDKASLGLKKIPRVETYRGLIFACFDEQVECLEEYLGDMRWYLDCMFDRFEGGVQVIGVPHKWQLEANWKLPVENQLGDVGHGPYLHGSLLQGTEQAEELEEYGHNIVPKPGHGLSVQLFPKDVDPARVMWGGSGFAHMDPEVNQYLLEQQSNVAQRLGELRARIAPLCHSIYPNLSFLWSNLTLRQSHPRGPGKTEYWSWFVVARDAPDHIKQKLQVNYNFFFGPGGVLEQEDSEAWCQQYRGSAIHNADDRSYYYGLGLDDPKTHPQLPGAVGSCFDEHYAREYYLRWRRDLERGGQQS